MIVRNGNIAEVKDYPLFSVVIPAYNAENFIQESLDSVAAQSWNNYEVVVIDDGSPDGTYSRVEDWIKKHSAVRAAIIRQENKGIGAARNAGVWNSRGEYVVFLDADDIWMKHKLETIAGYLDKSPSTDLVCHDELVETKNKKTLSTYGPYTSYRSLLFEGNCISTSATAVRRQRVQEVGGFSEDIRFNGVEDYDLWLKLAKHGCRIEYLHKVLGIYRVFGQGITNNVLRHNQNALNVLEAHFNEWQPATRLYSYLMRRRRGFTLRSHGHSLMQRGNHKEANRLFIRALGEDILDLKTWALIFLNFFRIRR